jgi:hypothetical protein
MFNISLLFILITTAVPSTSTPTTITEIKEQKETGEVTIYSNTPTTYLLKI